MIRLHLTVERSTSSQKVRGKSQEMSISVPDNNCVCGPSRYYSNP